MKPLTQSEIMFNLPQAQTLRLQLTINKRIQHFSQDNCTTKVNDSSCTYTIISLYMTDTGYRYKARQEEHDMVDKQGQYFLICEL